MNKEQIIFLKSKTSDHDENVKLDTDKFIEEMDLDNIPFDKQLFFIESGGTEEIFKEIYKNYKQPYVVLATNANNSLPAALEIVSFLRMNNLDYYLIHGKSNEVKEQLINLKKYPIFNYELKQYNKFFSGLKVGVIGKPSDWLISSNVNYDKAYDIFGVKIINITFDEFLRTVNENINNVDASLFKDHFNEKIDGSEIRKALVIYKALKIIAKRYNLSGLTVRCFDLLNTYHSTSCLALSLLNDEGIISACEGDVPSLLTMLFVKKVLNRLSFQCNPSYIDRKDNIIYLAHCTIPLKLCKSYTFDTHFESGIGVGIHGEVKDRQDVCILKFDSSLSRFALYSGRIVENMYKNNLCRTQIKVRLREPVNDILSSPCGNHLIVFHYDDKDKIIKLLSNWNF